MLKEDIIMLPGIDNVAMSRHKTRTILFADDTNLSISNKISPHFTDSQIQSYRH